MLLILLRNIGDSHIFGRKSRNLHGNVGQALLHGIVHHIGVRFHDNADSSAAVGIGNHAAVLRDNLLESSDVQILADGGDLLYQSFLHGLGGIRVPAFRHERVNIGRIGINRLLRNRFHELLEGLVLCNEVGLGIHFHNRRRGIILHRDAAKSFRGDPSGLLLSLGLAVLSQILHGRFHIAVRLIQSLLAVHHACAGKFS